MANSRFSSPRGGKYRYGSQYMISRMSFGASASTSSPTMTSPSTASPVGVRPPLSAYLEPYQIEELAGQRPPLRVRRLPEDGLEFVGVGGPEGGFAATSGYVPFVRSRRR